MRCRWIAVGVVVLFSIAPPGPALAAAVTPPPQRASQKLRAQPKVSPPKAKKSQPTATRKKTAPPVPMKPPALIPVVTEPASVWQGCLEHNDLPLLASRLGINETRLGSLLADEGLFGSDGAKCIPYVAATGGEGGVASATFQRTEPKAGSSPILALRKTADEVTLTPGACDCPEPVRRVLTAPVRDAANLSKDVIVGLPQNVRWQLDVLVPQMILRLASEQAALEQGSRPLSSEDLEAETERVDETPMDSYTVRVVVESHAANGPEHLQSIEIIEPATGKRVDGVWWLERPDGPGVFIGMQGLAYERLLWESPVKYVQTSRGVGPTLTTYQRRVPAPKGSKGPATVVRTGVIRGYHLGIDMLAPKGFEVHAVGDAAVSFAGRLGGFGNLIILDHGRGYQTYYAHLSRIGKGVKAGARVVGGGVIGLVGSTGHSTAPHLHFETRKDAKYLDPFDETRQLEFWLLTADDQERLAMQLLASIPTPTRDTSVANSEERSTLADTR